MERRYVVVALIALLIVPYMPISSGRSGSYVRYEITLVKPDYNSTVQVEVSVNAQRWFFWIAVPKDWDSSTLRAIKGKITSYSVKSLIYGGEANPFYNNLTIYGVDPSLIILSCGSSHFPQQSYLF